MGKVGRRLVVDSACIIVHHLKLIERTQKWGHLVHEPQCRTKRRGHLVNEPQT